MLRLENEIKNEVYNIYNILYNNKLDLEYIIKNNIEPDFVISSNKRGLLDKIIKKDLLTSKDYSVIKKKKGENNYVDVFLIIPEGYAEDNNLWDYGVVYINFNNKLDLEWRH